MYYPGSLLEGNDYSPSHSMEKNRHLNILSYASTLIVKSTTRNNILKDRLNQRSKIRFTDISVNFPRPFQSIKMYEDFIL